MTRAEWVKVIDERQNMYVKQLADIIKQNSLRKEIFYQLTKIKFCSLLLLLPCCMSWRII